MSHQQPKAVSDLQEIENSEWRESLDYVLQTQGPERVRHLLRLLQVRAQEQGVSIPFTANTPYINTIPDNQQPVFPGNRDIERRIKSIIRWNAMAMVVRANRESPGIGGHISTYASTATLWEMGFNHFWRGRTDAFIGDMVYFQDTQPRVFMPEPFWKAGSQNRTWNASATNWLPKVASPLTRTPF